MRMITTDDLQDIHNTVTDMHYLFAYAVEHAFEWHDIVIDERRGVRVTCRECQKSIDFTNRGTVLEEARYVVHLPWCHFVNMTSQLARFFYVMGLFDAAELYIPSPGPARPAIVAPRPAQTALGPYDIELQEDGNGQDHHQG